MASSGELAHAVKEGCLELSPVMSLAVVKFNAQTLWALRPSGEVVWELELNQPIERVLWRPDGHVLAMFGERGMFRLVDMLSGRCVLELEQGFKVNYSHWCHATFMEHEKSSGCQFVVNDILPVLEGVSVEETVLNKGSDLDFMVLATTQGISLVFSNILSINLELLQGCNVKSIVASRDLKRLYVAVERDFNVELVELDLAFIDNTTRDTTKAYGKMLEIMLTIRKSLAEIVKVHTPFVDYTYKIMQLLKEEHEEGVEPIDDLYDLLLTGNVTQEAKKWLTDYLGDRGIKRWLKLGQTYFEFAKTCVFITFIAALTHLITLLDGLELVNLLEIPTAFLKESYSFIVELNEFQFQFQQTMSWLAGVLKELAGDQPPKGQVPVKDVVKFLLFASSLTGDGVSVGCFPTMLEKLELSLNAQVDNVKTTMCSKAQIVQTTAIGMADDVEMCPYLGHVTLLLRRGDTLDLKQAGKSTTKTFDGLVAVKILPTGQIVVAQPHSITVFDENLENKTNHAVVETEIAQFDANVRENSINVMVLNADGRHFEWVSL